MSPTVPHSTPSFVLLVRAAALGGIALVSACGDDDDLPSSSGTGGAGGGAPRTLAIYGDPLTTNLLPFPSNRYTVPDATTRTGLRVDVSPATTADPFVASYASVVERMGELDGFSTVGGIAIGFDRPIDGSAFAGPQGGQVEETLDPLSFTAAGSPLLLVDVDPASPDLGRAIGLLPRAFAQPKDTVYLADEFTIVARPAEPLAPGRRYLFVATRSLTDETGASVGATAETRALFDGTTEGPYADEVRAGLDVLESSLGVSRADVAVASSFTTATVHDQLLALAEDARASAPPELLEPWTIETEGEDDTRVRYRAVFSSPEYRRASDGTFEIGADGRPVVQDVVGVEVFLAFADRETSGPRPLVIYQHGLGGDKDGCWGTTDRLAELGAAVIAIDSPEHGSRGDASETLGSVFAFFGVDPSTLDFDLGRARDNFRQMAADQLELVRFIATQGDLDLLPMGAPDGMPDLETAEVLYIGHSFGAVQGPTIMALAPEIRHAVWNVGGDHLTLMMEDSDTFGLLVGAIAPPGTADGALSRFFSATQAIVDPGDPLNFARFTLRETAPGVAPAGPRSVLLQEVVDDNIVPNSSTEVLARAAGLALGQRARDVPGVGPVALPSRGDGPGGSTAVLAQFATMNGGETATHGSLIFSEEARSQYVRFFQSGIDDGVATVDAGE